MLSNDWKIPLNIAVGLHVLILLGGLYLPGIFKAKPKFADIYTVSIINIAEPAATEPPPSAQSAEEPPPVAAKPVKAKTIAPIAEPIKQPVVSPPKSVSLKPLKKKKVVKVEKREDDHAQKERERQRRQKLAQALREEELLEEKARLAREALEAERRLLQSQRAAVSQPAVSKGSGTGSASNSNSVARGSSNILESQLYAAIKNRLAQYWVLPDYLQKDISLTATAVITINRDGSVANMFFESRSGNRVFDQFVKKTIESADPFPPIPPAMKKQRFEVGLVFRPAGIQ
ncbi:MAG: TonB family protein [Desulforhopalus sp.]